jgi:O-antigen/teichoic acid export membrane protein
MSRSDRFSALRNIFLSSVSSYIEYAIFLAAGVLIARSLEPSVYGVYAYSVWLGSLLVIVCNHGLTITAIRFCAQARGQGKPERAMAIAGLLNRWHTYSCVVAFAGFFTVLALVPPKEWGNDLYLYILLTVVGTLGRATCLMKISIGKGFEEFTIGNITSVIGSLVSLGWVLYLVAFKGTVLQFFIAFTAVGLLTGAISTIALRSKGIHKVDTSILDKDIRRRLLASTGWTAAVMVLITLGGRTFEMLTLKSYGSTELVGFFAIAGVLAKGTADLLAGGFDKVLLPLLTRRMQGADAKTTGYFVAEATRYYFFLGMALAGAGYASMEGAMSVLYGVKYLGAVNAVTITIAVTGACLISSAFNAFQISSDNQRDRVIAASVAVVVSGLSSIAFVPKLGLNGALISVALTSLTGLAMSIYQVKKSIPFSLPIRAFAALFFSSAIGAVTGHWISSFVGGKFGFVVGGCVFVTIYIFCSAFTRAWSMSDYDLVGSLVGKVPVIGSRISVLIVKMKSLLAFDADRFKA